MSMPLTDREQETYDRLFDAWEKGDEAAGMAIHDLLQEAGMDSTPLFICILLAF